MANEIPLTLYITEENLRRLQTIAEKENALLVTVASNVLNKAVELIYGDKREDYNNPDPRITPIR